MWGIWSERKSLCPQMPMQQANLLKTSEHNEWKLDWLYEVLFILNLICDNSSGASQFSGKMLWEIRQNHHLNHLLHHALKLSLSALRSPRQSSLTWYRSHSLHLIILIIFLSSLYPVVLLHRKFHLFRVEWSTMQGTFNKNLKRYQNFKYKMMAHHSNSPQLKTSLICLQDFFICKPLKQTAGKTGILLHASRFNIFNIKMTFKDQLWRFLAASLLFLSLWAS